MTELKMTTKTANYVDAYDLIEFLSDHLGSKIEFVGSGNDTDYSYELSKDDLDEDDIADFLETEYIDCQCYEFAPALQYLIREDLIPEGAYVVSVSW